MSRNRHRSTAPAAGRVYPSPQARERIIGRREKLLRQLILLMVTAEGRRDNRRMATLIDEYGAPEVQRVVETFQRHANPTLISEAATSYRHYRLAFARFGGRRPFLAEVERGRLQEEHAKLMLPRDPFGADLPASPRETELNDLLLSGDSYWDDITPPDIPTRPADFVAPAPGRYLPPAQGLLDWGWDLDPRRYRQEAQHPTRWQSTLPDLARMALDPGLLRGWPGETASWAPYHAVHLLGQLRAHPYAAHLLGLLDETDDWLSDCLPANWGRMGPAAAAPLWGYVDDRRHMARSRAVCLSGLAYSVDEQPQARANILRGFITRLENSLSLDGRFNGYLIYVLDRQLHAREARAAIETAYQQKKIDLSVMRPEEVGLLEISMSMPADFGSLRRTAVVENRTA